MSIRNSRHYEVIVLGVGAMGSATIYQIARRGRRVLGIESHGIPNQRGSSRGLTRILRLAYYEAAEYVPLALRARRLWRELEDRIGERLLHVTGSIDAGPSDSAIVEGSRKSCELHGLDHTVMSSTELTRRFPGFRLPLPMVALLQPDGGFLSAERCILAYTNLAQYHGARIHSHERVLHWEPTPQGALVVTDQARYTSERLVITTGVWAGQLLAPLRHKIAAERQVVAWFQPRKPALFSPQSLPVFNVSLEEGHFAGIPMFGDQGFKYARAHHLAEIVSPDSYETRVSERDEEVVRKSAERYFPDGAGETIALATCLFENSPDGHFIIDQLPDYQQVSFAAGFSGHGFKFSSAVGEILALLVEDKSPDQMTKTFRMERFANERVPSGGVHSQPGKLSGNPSADRPTGNADDHSRDKTVSMSQANYHHGQHNGRRNQSPQDA